MSIKVDPDKNSRFASCGRVEFKNAPGDAGDSQLMSAKGVGRSLSAVGERGGRGSD